MRDQRGGYMPHIPPRKNSTVVFNMIGGRVYVKYIVYRGYFYINFAKPVFVKKFYIFLEFSSPSARCIADGFPTTCLEPLNLRHSSVMRLIVSSLSQSSQVEQALLLL